MSPASSRALLTAALAAALLAACEGAPVVPTSDPRQSNLNSRIEGSVVVSGRTRGNVLVLLYDEKRPPAPQGTGRPVAFTVVPGATVFGDALGDLTRAGPFTAPFAFSQIEPANEVSSGRYLLRGFVDHDECQGGTPGCRTPDFNPWYSVVNEPNKGDLGGAAVDAATRANTVVEIKADEEGRVAPVTGVTVTFSEGPTTLVPADRPAFSAAAGSTSTFTPGAGVVKAVDLNATPINEGVVDQRFAQAFLVRFVDDNLDGIPDLIPGTATPATWPKVFLRKLDSTQPSNLVDENDADRNGILDDAPGSFRDYEHAAAGADGKPDAVILAAALAPPASVAGALVDSGGVPKKDAAGNFITLVSPTMKLIIQSGALDVSNPLKPEPLKTVPPGRYAIIVMEFTGQTWRLPNELAPEIGPTLGLPGLSSQGFFIEVPAPQ